MAAVIPSRRVLLGVLGPVLLHGAGRRSGAVGSGRQRRLLAALALHAGTDGRPGRAGRAGVGRRASRPTRWPPCRPTWPGCAGCCPAAVSIRTGPRGYRLDVAGRRRSTRARFAPHLAAAAAATADPGRRLAELDAALRAVAGPPVRRARPPGRRARGRPADRAARRRAGGSGRGAARPGPGRRGGGRGRRAGRRRPVARARGRGADPGPGRRRAAGRGVAEPSPGCAPSWPSSSAPTRHRSCAGCTSRCCARSCRAVAARTPRPAPSRSARSSAGTPTWIGSPRRCSRAGW